jgi:hypothetical protein
MGVSGQCHVLAALPPGKGHDSYLTETWVGHRGGADRCRKSRPLPGFDPRTVQPVASSPQTETRKTEFCSGIACLITYHNHHHHLHHYAYYFRTLTRHADTRYTIIQ